MFPESVSPEEQQKIDKEFRKLRFERLKERSQAEVNLSRIMQMKIRLQNYFTQNGFTDQFSFANQLSIYIGITGLKKKEFANIISIHPTKLSRLIKGVDAPNIDLMFRLAIHSNDEIPAFYWWRLYAREFENSIRKDIKRKVEEAEKVKSSMKFRA